MVVINGKGGEECFSFTLIALTIYCAVTKSALIFSTSSRSVITFCTELPLPVFKDFLVCYIAENIFPLVLFLVQNNIALICQYF